MKQVIYINSRPFVLRDVEQPFSNLEYTVRIALKPSTFVLTGQNNYHVDGSESLEKVKIGHCNVRNA